jgi:FKBP-type peptidyl-prolyl cis-trans isomerase
LALRGLQAAASQARRQRATVNVLVHRPIAIAIVCVTVFVAACSEPQPVTSLQIKDTRVGAGTEATPGRVVKVHYTGTLLDGKEVDSSRGRQPLEFRLGAGDVIAGWDEGIKGMKVGGVRELTIPANMAYGSKGRGDAVPPNSPLWFEVELLEVK